MRMNKVNAPCTILLAAMNVIVFIVLTSRGMTEDGAYYMNIGCLWNTHRTGRVLSTVYQYVSSFWIRTSDE